MKNKENIENLAKKTVKELFCEKSSPLQQAGTARLFFDELTNLLSDGDSAPTRISSPNVLIEVIDSSTGKLYRRYLELDFHETGNGIRLRGEDIGGNPAEIVFLSNTAIEQIKELQGFGPDLPRCEDE
ncbi:MAG: hypothetical protein Q4A19_04290 [Johnsonella sp.]|nr:hypothetical protein [Johnsonella sp.]